MTLDLRRGLILRVAQPSQRDLEEFFRTRVPLDKPSKVVPIDLARIDPSTFNFVDVYQKWPVFRLCTKIIPSAGPARLSHRRAAGARAIRCTQ